MKLRLNIFSLSAIIFIVIIFSSILIRFTSLSSLPVSLYWDEVSEGYNSYSILQTGKDEYGTSFPILFRGYDDQKMPVYIYLSVIPIFLFGLGEFSVRFLSALSGVGSVVVCYFLVKELFKKEKLSNFVGLVSAFTFSIVPWSVQLSRAGFEANLALFFVMLGSLFIFKSRDKKWFLLAAALAFVVSIYTYRSSLIVVPPLFFLSLFFLRRSIVKTARYKFTGFVLLLFAILSLPLIFTFLKAGDSRSSEVSIFTSENPKIKENILKQESTGNIFISKLVYNRRIVYAEEALGNYVSHFSPNFLFLNGDVNPRHSLGNIGQLYLWQFPFIIIGLIYLLKKFRTQSYFLSTWLLLSPIPASFSLPSPHALRSLLMLPPLIIFSSVGLYVAYQLCRGKIKLAFSIMMIVVVLGSALIYAKSYVRHNSFEASSDWGDGYKELIDTIKPQLNDYDKIIISGHFWQPYMYTLFYTHYDPKLYQGSGSQTGFGKFIFGGTEWDLRLHRQGLEQVDLEKLAGSKNTLVALSPEEYQAQEQNIKKINQIKNHKGEIVFIVGSLRE